MSENLTLESTVTEEWLQSVVDNLPGAALTLKPEWEALTLTVGGKLFGMFGEDSKGLPLITLKGDPLDNEALRQQYQDIIPGYYSNKKHWNSVILESTVVPADLVAELIQESYRLVFASLTKKVREEIG